MLPSLAAACWFTFDDFEDYAADNPPANPRETFTLVFYVRPQLDLVFVI